MRNLPCRSVWPEWELTEYLGGGAYGEVYRAVRTDSGVTSVSAIKIIRIPGDSYELEALRSEGIDREGTVTYLKELVTSFTNEIQIMESFKGIQNIVSIEDYQVVRQDEGYEISIRMELLTPLNRYLDNGQMSEQEILQLGIDLCNALDICARRNIIHRDIKPENVFINRYGDFKLGDFGVARSLENRSSRMSAKGTYHYMAPEVIRNRVYDSRADIYSLGIMLYRLANGNRLPFLSERQLLSPQERQAALERRLNGALLPPPCDASPALSRIILKACAYLPEDRYASAAELRRELTALMRSRMEGETVSVRHAGTEMTRTETEQEDPNVFARKNMPAQEQSERKRTVPLWAIIAGTALATLLIVGLVLRIAGVWPAKEEAEEAEKAETVVVQEKTEEEAPAAAAEAPSETAPETVPEPAAEPAPAPTPKPPANPIDRLSPDTPPTLEDLRAIIDSDRIKTVSNKGVRLSLPTESQLLAVPYRAELGGLMKTDTAYVMPVDESGNGNLGTIARGTEVWVICETPYYCFFVADNGVMGWNGSGFFVKK